MARCSRCDSILVGNACEKCDEMLFEDSDIENSSEKKLVSYAEDNKESGAYVVSSLIAPVFAGAIIGLLLRFGFSGKPGEAYSAMLSAFIFLAPAVCGAVTVYVAELSKRRSFIFYIFAPMLSTIMMVLGSAIALLEGAICIIMVLPLFLVITSISGVIMGIICRVANSSAKKNTLYSLLVLPLVLGAIEPRFPNPNKFSSTTKTVFVNASPERIWSELNNVSPISPDELDKAWAFKIGVPMLYTASTEVYKEGHIRKIRWRKNIHFEGIITEWEPNRKLQWRYRFQEDSFPKRALDDHIVIGGDYFDLDNVTFTLHPKDQGTEVKMQVSWRVTTRFNWYADRIANFLLSDFNENILIFYKNRSEKKV